jgi:hypothetical protein
MIIDMPAPALIHLQRSVDVAKNVAQLSCALTLTEMGERLQSVLLSRSDLKQLGTLGVQASEGARQRPLLVESGSIRFPNTQLAVAIGVTDEHGGAFKWRRQKGRRRVCLVVIDR